LFMKFFFLYFLIERIKMKETNLKNSIVNLRGNYIADKLIQVWD
jgi:hypothetical protein